MHFDPDIIASHAGFDVLADTYTIPWPDGSTVGVHRVQVYGYPDLFLRATRLDNTSWAIFDSRQITTLDLEGEVKALPLRDHPGALAYHILWAHIDAHAAQLAMAAKATIRWAIEPQPAGMHEVAA